MATNKKDPEHGVVGRLATAGEEATNRLFEALGKNTTVTDALTRAMSAKGKLDTASRGAISQIGLGTSDEVKELRKQVERLEKRLSKLEAGSGSRPSAKRSETKKTPTAKRSTKRASAAKSEKPVSPAPGRAIGGGPGRGAGPSAG